MTEAHVRRFRLQAAVMPLIAVVLWFTVGAVWPWLVVGSLLVAFIAAPMHWKRQLLGRRHS